MMSTPALLSKIFHSYFFAKKLQSIKDLNNFVDLLLKKTRYRCISYTIHGMKVKCLFHLICHFWNN